MKKLIIGVGALLAVIIAGLFVAPSFIPMDTYKPLIAEQVQKATGRELRIDGEIDLALLPRVALAVDKVSLSNAPGATAPSMMELAELKVNLQVLPLIFGGELVVDQFVLVDPVINLEVDADGKPNWTMAPADGQPKQDTAPGDGDTGTGGGLGDLRLGDIRLVNGTLSYSDAATGRREEVTGINMRVALPGLDQPMEADGSLTWNGEEVALTVRAEEPRALLEGRETAAGFGIESKPVTLTYDGRLANAATPSVAGKIALSVPSIRDLAAWSGTPIEMAGDGLGPLNIEGDLSFDGKRAALANTAIAVDAIKGAGDFSVDIGGTKPAIVAKLALEMLDLNPYLPADAGADDKQDTAKTDGEPADWSDEPIDASGLTLVDADLEIKTQGIRARDITIGQSELSVTLKDGKLTANLAKLELYEGSANGKLTLDGSGKATAVGYQLALDGVQAEPLLRDAAGFERLLGTASAKLSGQTSGTTQRQLVAGLNGDGAVTFLDGAIKGINLAAMVRGLSAADLNSAFEGASSTDFAELSGSFAIQNGLMSNQDLALKAPLLRADGAGRVNLPDRTLKYRIVPKAVASLKGQGSTEDAPGLAVPVVAEGPWHDLRYRPDVEGTVKDKAGKILEGVTKGEDPKDALKDAKKGIKDLLKGFGQSN